MVRHRGFVTRLQQITMEPLIFPLFSVTQTLGHTTVYDSERRKAMHGLPEHLSWEVFVFIFTCEQCKTKNNKILDFHHIISYSCIKR